MPSELLAALETLERGLAEVKRSTLLGRLQPGLDPATTRAALAEQGFSPRKDVEELFSWHNGTTTDQILPMDDIYLIPWKYFLNLEETFGWMEILDPSRTPNRALPVLSDDGGGLLIIDWTNGAMSTTGMMIPSPRSSTGRCWHSSKRLTRVTQTVPSTSAAMETLSGTSIGFGHSEES